MEFFLKYKTIIIRSLGAAMLVVGFATYFWVTPKEGISENDKAAARVARMEAKVSGSSSTQQSQPRQKDTSKFMNAMKETQNKQIKYLLILLMLVGIGFLAYSFLGKKRS